MKNIVVVFVVGVGLFGLSAGVSWFLRPAESKGPEQEKSGLDHNSKGLANPAGLTYETGQRPAVRPSPMPNPDNIVHLTAHLQSRQEALQKREEEIANRKKNLDLIYQDLRNERKSLDDVHQQLKEEMKTLQDKMDALEKKNNDLDRQKQKIVDQTKDLKQSFLELEGVEQNRIKQVAGMYDTMEADKAAEILHHMADSGKMETAVKILATMRERQAARVLAQMPDPAIVVQLLEKMKGLKRPTSGGM